jgi:hypothetical protein
VKFRILRPSLISLFLVAVSLSGQEAGGAASSQAPAAKNLKILAPKTDIDFVMENFSAALGVQCTYCHVQGDFASDANPHKETARRMIAMARQIDANFASSGGVFPAGYHEVDCSTCHRGKVMPETKAPADFWSRGDSLGLIIPKIVPGVNLTVLPASTRVHGDGSIMHDFRDALHVDCDFCHSAKGFQLDDNPRKDVARKMIVMVRQINANFPGTGVYPEGTQAVTCYTCHRGDPHPASASNNSFPAPKR